MERPFEPYPGHYRGARIWLSLPIIQANASGKIRVRIPQNRVVRPVRSVVVGPLASGRYMGHGRI